MSGYERTTTAARPPSRYAASTPATVRRDSSVKLLVGRTCARRRCWIATASSGETSQVCMILSVFVSLLLIWGVCNGHQGVGVASLTHVEALQLVALYKASLRRRSRNVVSNPSASRRRQLELDVVRVAERQHVDAERRKVPNLTVWHGALVQQPGRRLQIAQRRHTEANMVQPHAMLIEAVAGRDMALTGGTQAKERRAVDEHDAAHQRGRQPRRHRIVGGCGHLRRHLEPQHARVKRARPLYIRHGHAYVMNRADAQRLRHGGTSHLYGLSPLSGSAGNVGGSSMARADEETQAVF